MEREYFEILGNESLTKNIYRLTLKGNTREIQKPGQFVNLALPGFFLRRPISVCDYTSDTLTLIYKVVGKGTEYLATLKNGTLDLLTGLGNGYDTSYSGKAPVLIGGGVGVPPLYHLAKCLCEEGKKVTVILGFNTKAEIFYEPEFSSLGADVLVLTADGSYGQKGFVTDALKDLDYSYFYACGPLPMFQAMEKVVTTSGQYSLEERMGCGFGACMGCSLQTKQGPKRVCKDGPVFFREDILW